MLAEILGFATSLGFNLAYVVAGFSGAIVSLYFMRVPRTTAALVVSGGALVANYLTAVVQQYLAMPDAARNGVAFICGIVAMSLVRGIMKRGEKWSDDPNIDLKGGNPNA